MTAKLLLFRDEARDKIRRGVDALAESVKVTLGPRGRTVILDRDFGPPQIVNSGELVAKSVELENRFGNMGAQLLQDLAVLTGGTVISHKLGLTLAKAQLTDLGRAKRVEVVQIGPRRSHQPAGRGTRRHHRHPGV